MRNAGAVARTRIMAVNEAGVVMTQRGQSAGSSDCAFEVAVSADADPATGTLNLTGASTCGWAATTTVPWISVSESGGMGSGQFRYALQPSSIQESSIGHIDVAGQTVAFAGPALAVPGLVCVSLPVPCGFGGPEFGWDLCSIQLCQVHRPSAPAPPPTPPVLQMFPPGAPMRGEERVFRLQNASGAQITGWQFVPADDAIGGPISRARDAGSTEWRGRLYTSGTVRVEVRKGGVNYPLSVSVQVRPRDWRSAPPQVQGDETSNSLQCADRVRTFSDAPSPAHGLGGSCPVWSWDFVATNVNDDGPNHGMRYVASATTLATWRYTINRQLANPTSQFYEQQWGVNGWISGASLLNGMRRHEHGAINSHFALFLDVWQDPDNDWRALAEPLVAGPSRVATFDESVRLLGDRVFQAVITEYELKPEPCDPNWNDTCTQSRGNINWHGLPPE